MKNGRTDKLVYSPCRTIRRSSFKSEISLCFSSSSFLSKAKSKTMILSLTIRQWTFSNLEPFRGSDNLRETWEKKCAVVPIYAQKFIILYFVSYLFYQKDHPTRPLWDITQGCFGSKNCFQIENRLKFREPPLDFPKLFHLEFLLISKWS